MMLKVTFLKCVNKALSSVNENILVLQVTIYKDGNIIDLVLTLGYIGCIIRLCR